MPKRILILDCGPGIARVIAEARALGYCAVVFSEDDAAPHTQTANEVRTGECLDPTQVMHAIEECKIDGVFPPFGHCSFPAAFAANRSNLPALTDVAAAWMQYKHNGFAVLEKRGVPAVKLHVAETALQAKEAARDLGMPVWIGSDETYSQTGIYQVDQIEDTALAFSQATRHSLVKTAVVMRPVRGLAFYVDGIVLDGTFHLSGLIGRDTGEPPFRFDRGLFAPPALSPRERDEIVGVAVKALDALECRNGCVHVVVIMTDESPVVMDVLGAPSALRFPADILLRAHGIDTLGNTLRFAAGEPPRFEAASNRGAALFWIPARSGVVTEIRGIEEARGVPGVEEVVMELRPGDVMRHAVDCETRDRVGYVLATGDDAETAVRAAKQAINLCQIETRPAYS